MDKIKALLAGKDPVKWLFYGDSITHGAVHTWGERDYTELFTERVRFELGRSQDIVIKTAIDGNNTADLLASFDWRVAQFKPHVVFVMIGMNDCSTSDPENLVRFSANLGLLADRFDEIGALPVYQTTCPIIPKSSPDREPHFDAYMDAVRSVAKERGIPLVDHTAWWKKHIGNHWYWMDNAFHPNGAGHRAFARLLFEELGIWDEKSNTGRMHIPGL